jgi:hypothetical protein
VATRGRENSLSCQTSAVAGSLVARGITFLDMPLVTCAAK